MSYRKFICKQCGERFELLEIGEIGALKCPRCSNGNIKETNTCTMEVGSPPWEYKCDQCGIKFQVEAPSGPDEAHSMKCPVCGSQNVKWLAYISEACPTGG